MPMRIPNFVALCGLSAMQLAISAAAQPPQSPPSQEQLHRETVARGPGSCNDLLSIRDFPGKAGTLGQDAAYDRVHVHIDWYLPCLDLALKDQSPAHSVRLSPGVTARTVSDVAFAILVDTGKLEWGLCTPPEMREDGAGVSSFYAWLDDPENRRKWQVCISNHFSAKSDSSTISRQAD
jgi:hypothetical protein